MAQRPDRFTIELKDLRDRIENFRSDPAWKALSLSKKIRVLIEMGLSQGEIQEEQPAEDEPYKSLGDLISDHWEALQQSKIPLKRLKELRDGAKPTAAEQVRIGAVVEDADLVIDLVERMDDHPKRKSGNGV